MAELTTPEAMKEAALEYVQMKLPILPVCSHDHSGMGSKHLEACKAPGKAPLLPKWTERGVPTENEIEQWYSQWPSQNIGLVLGDSDSEYNLVGIDVDGEIGEELLQEHSKGVLPPTWEFDTGKGRRLIYELPEGAESKKKAMKGEDGELAFLATGQHTTMPPSIHPSGRIYSWTRHPDEQILAPAPQWLLNIILLVHGGDSATPASTVSPEDWQTRLEKGKRNDGLTKLAGSLIARRNIPKEQIISFLRTWNEQNCVPPLPDQEITVMVENLHASELAKQASFKKGEGAQARPVLRPITFAEHFVEQQKLQNVEWRFCVGRGVFYTCDALIGPWQTTEPVYVQRAIRKALVDKEESWDSQKHVNEVMYALKEYLADPVNDELFDVGKHPDLDNIYVQNGVLDWKTLELKDWRPDTYSTVKLPAMWDLEAENTEAYEKWQDCLAQWLPDEATRDFLQEYIGYCLIPDCSFRTAVFLYGGGSNGKSLFLDIVSKLFNPYISFVPLPYLGERFETTQLIDKLINICADIDNKYMNETSTVKSLISGDTIRAEYKHGKSFHFHPTARLMFSANALPRSSDRSEGWYSRWRFIEFPQRFKTDTRFKRELMRVMDTPEALSALLHWSVEGLRRLYNIEEFSEGNVMQVAAKQYRIENDSVIAFFDDVLLSVGHKGSETTLTVGSLYNTYHAWCEDHHIKPVNHHEFIRRMGAAGVIKAPRQIRGVSTQCFLGVEFSGSGETRGYKEEYQFSETIRQSSSSRRQRSGVTHG